MFLEYKFYLSHWQALYRYTVCKTDAIMNIRLQALKISVLKCMGV